MIENISLITKTQPFSQKISVEIKGFNKSKHRVMVSVDNVVFETIYSESRRSFVTFKPFKMIQRLNLNDKQPLENYRIKAFIYNFIDDEIVEAKLKEYNYVLKKVIPDYPDIYHLNGNELMSTSKVIMGVWDKKSIVDKAKKEVVVVFENFKIDFSLNNSYKTFVPLAIPDFNNNPENYSFVFNYSLSLSNIDELNFTIQDENDSIVFTKFYLKPVEIKSIVKSKNLKKKVQEKSPIPIINSKDLDIYYTNVGNYQLYWEGFNDENIFDSSLFNNKKFKATITAYKNGKFKKAEVEFQTKYNEVNWVDVKINRKTKRIDTTLRVNLKDGGAFGLECKQEQIVTSTLDVENDNGLPKFKTVCPWDRIPKDILKPENPIIKERTQSFKELEKFALDGINYHWGRNKNHAVAKSININGEVFQMYMNAVNSIENSLDDVDLIFNTNSNWLRSGNPGSVDDPISAVGNLISREAVCYNVGYIKYSNGWNYQNEINEIIEYKETSAHEIGHTLLKSFGGTFYSYGHKGTVNTYSQNENENAINYPTSGEIDIMPYYKNYIPINERKKMIASEKDVFGLIWLTKLNLK